MSDPSRWLDDGGELDDDERRALAAGMNLAVPHEAKDALWRSLGRKLPLAAAGAAAGATATKAAAAISLAKMGLAGLLLGSVAAAGLVGAEHLLSSPRPTASAVRHPGPVAPHVEPAAPRAEPKPPLDPTPELPNPVAPLERPTASHKPANDAFPPEPQPIAPERSVASFPVPAPTTTVEVDGGASLESRRVAEARAALRGGNARAALTTLTALRRDFPNGVLVQEREALIIETLLALGESAKARELAAKFIARYPGSPHAAAAKRALE
jgi:hypothetical protein